MDLGYIMAAVDLELVMLEYKLVIHEYLKFTSSRLGMAAVAGACGGFVGTPGDMTNVRSEPPEN